MSRERRSMTCPICGHTADTRPGIRCSSCGVRRRVLPFPCVACGCDDNGYGELTCYREKCGELAGTAESIGLRPQTLQAASDWGLDLNNLMATVKHYSRNRTEGIPWGLEESDTVISHPDEIAWVVLHGFFARAASTKSVNRTAVESWRHHAMTRNNVGVAPHRYTLKVPKPGRSMNDTAKAFDNVFNHATKIRSENLARSRSATRSISSAPFQSDTTPLRSRPAVLSPATAAIASPTAAIASPTAAIASPTAAIASPTAAIASPTAAIASPTENSDPASNSEDNMGSVPRVLEPSKHIRSAGKRNREELTETNSEIDTDADPETAPYNVGSNPRSAAYTTAAALRLPTSRHHLGRFSYVTKEGASTFLAHFKPQTK